MIEWLSNTFDLRFYYWTGLNWIILFPTYLIGAGLLALLWWWLAKRMRSAWIVIAPLVMVLIIAPWVEELWIARNFGQLCKKDAGIFIHKVVEVEGFYDATRPTHAGPRTEAAAKDLDRGGYRFYEMVFRNHKDGRNQVVHLEKAKGVWTAAVIDHPTARYHYGKDSGIPVAHKVYRQSSKVVEMPSQEVLARYVRYSRQAPWFFVSLGDPGLGCDGPDGGPNTQHSFLIYRDVLKPIVQTGGVQK